MKRQFIWGNFSPFHIPLVTNEFADSVYERFFTVKDGDVVFDAGASVGPFIYSLYEREVPIRPKAIYAVEPLMAHFPALVKNVDGRAVIIPKALSDNKIEKIEFGGISEICDGSSFMEIVKSYGIDHIDFLKTDCEGGEYDVFRDENINWLIKNVKYCVGEWHLSTPELKAKFRHVRDKYFHVFKRIEVYSVNHIDIKSELYTDRFIEYYSEIILHIEL